MSANNVKCSDFYWAKFQEITLSEVWAELATDSLRRFGLPIRAIEFSATLGGDTMRFVDDPESLADLASVMPTCTTGDLGIYASREGETESFVRWEGCAVIQLKGRYSFLGVTDSVPIELAELSDLHLAMIGPIVKPAYGISYTHPLWLAPWAYANGTLSGRIATDRSPEAKAYQLSVREWSSDTSDDQKGFHGWFRDVYPHQFLSPEHVSIRLQDGRSFMDSEIGKLTPYGEDRWWWSVDEAELSTARDMLAAASRLLCPPTLPSRWHIPKNLLSRAKRQ